MPLVTGYTKEKMDEIADSVVVDGSVVVNDLILERADGTTINAGNVRGPIGSTGPTGPTSIAVVTSGTRPTGGSLFNGLAIYETDTKRFYIYDSATTTWVYRGGLWLCTSATRPASPFEGLEIYETDTDRKYTYSGSAWRFIYHLGNENKVEINYTAPAGADAPTAGALTDYLNLGNVTVPSWATKARLTCSINGWYDKTTANHTYQARINVGTDVGKTITDQGKGVVVRFTTAWSSPVTLTSTGVKALILQVAKTGGTNQLTADAATTVNVLIEFLP